MKDDDLKHLFSDYNPELQTSDEDFMDTLARNMEAVDAVKQQIAATNRRYKRAAVLSAVIGFAAGSLMTLILSEIGTFEITIPRINIVFSSANMSWLIIAGTTTMSALTAFAVTQTKMGRAEARPCPNS